MKWIRVGSVEQRERKRKRPDKQGMAAARAVFSSTGIIIDVRSGK